MKANIHKTQFVSPVEKMKLLTQVTKLHKLVDEVSTCYVTDVSGTDHVNLDFLRVVHKLHENNLELIKRTSYLISIGMSNDSTLKSIVTDIETFQKRINFIYNAIDNEKEITDQVVRVSHTGFDNNIVGVDLQNVLNHQEIDKFILNLDHWCALDLSMSTELSKTLRNNLEALDHLLGLGGMGLNKSLRHSNLTSLEIRRKILFIKTVLWK